MTTIEMISALHKIKRTCRGAGCCIDCPFHKMDEAGNVVCAFEHVFTTPSIWDDDDLMLLAPDDWKLDELEGI